MADGFRAEGRRHLSESATPERRAARGAKIRASRQQGAAPPRPCEHCGTTYVPTGTRQRDCADCGSVVRRERGRERDARRRGRRIAPSRHTSWRSALKGSMGIQPLSAGT